MATIELKQEINELSLINFSNSLEEKITNWRTQIKPLEKRYTSDSTSAITACDYTSILVILDKVKELANNRQFHPLSNAIDHTIIEIKKFIDAQYEESLSVSEVLGIIQPLCYGIDKLAEASDVIKKGCELSINIVKSSLNNDQKTLKTWAENLELFGDVLEDSIRLMNLEILKSLQFAMSNIIEKASKKSPEIAIKTDTEESYRIRIRNAAGFIYRLIEFTIEESEEEEQEILDAIIHANYPAFFEE